MLAALCVAPVVAGAVVAVASNGTGASGHFAADRPVPPSPGASLNSGEFDELTMVVPQRPGVDGRLGSDRPAQADVPVNGALDGSAVVRPGRPDAVNGIPRGVFPAYVRATANLAVVRPHCGLTWPLLAGIGKVESSHASGGRVDVTGTTRGRILGPVLNGDRGLGLVRDTDKGRWDRDTYWDRPVGPMQIIPSIWTEWGADGNGDGFRNPNNVYDAVTTVAAYLCADGHDLKDPRDLVRALLLVNHSKNFVATVLRWMRVYSHSAVLVPNEDGEIAKAKRSGNAERKVDPRKVPEIPDRPEDKPTRPTQPIETQPTVAPTPPEPIETDRPSLPTVRPTTRPTSPPTKPTPSPTQTPTPTVTPTPTPTDTPTPTPTDTPGQTQPPTGGSSETPCKSNSETDPSPSPSPSPSCEPASSGSRTAISSSAAPAPRRATSGHDLLD